MVKFFEIQKDDILPTEDITIHKTWSGTEFVTHNLGASLKLGNSGAFECLKKS